ncbi:MAG: hypothetical protein J3K34DRAFT_174441 [Monoraphidium minutum]|nr:MAG: hypothetical protein J3K34DRAFT_174441 [Monoraphidium minutum]
MPPHAVNSAAVPYPLQAPLTASLQTLLLLPAAAADTSGEQHPPVWLPIRVQLYSSHLPQVGGQASGDRGRRPQDASRMVCREQGSHAGRATRGVRRPAAHTRYANRQRRPARPAAPPSPGVTRRRHRAPEALVLLPPPRRNDAAASGADKAAVAAGVLPRARQGGRAGVGPGSLRVSACFQRL